MNELLKGLIGAELTLLGVPNQGLPKNVASEPTRALPRSVSQGGEHDAKAVQGADSSSQASGTFEFSEHHYRIAAG